MGFGHIKYNSTHKYAMLRVMETGRKTYAPFVRTKAKRIRFTKRNFPTAAAAIMYRRVLLLRAERMGVNLMGDL